MRVAIGVDHGGFPLKGPIVDYLTTAGHKVLDLGAHNMDPEDDYPDYAKAVGEAVLRGEAERGIIICGSGVGACVAANKLPGIRAGLCHDTYSAHQGVEHDNINVLCLGARIIGVALALELVQAFIGATFSGEERHRRRVAKIAGIEAAQTLTDQIRQISVITEHPPRRRPAPAGEKTPVRRTS